MIHERKQCVGGFIMISAQEFRNQYIGKAIDVDNAYGAQCVDLFKQCCILAGKSAFSLGGSGLAFEIARRFDALGLGQYFNRVSLSSIRYGDWIVWDRNVESRDSHVAMFIRWDGVNRVIVLGQNQLGIRASNEGSLGIQGILAVLRLKTWAQPQATKPSIDMIAAEVLQGKWGNGAARKASLEAAGYSYEAIQAKVNQLLNVTPVRKSVDDIAKEVIKGLWGNGSERINRLRQAGYDATLVQTRVNSLLR